MPSGLPPDTPGAIMKPQGLQGNSAGLINTGAQIFGDLINSLFQGGSNRKQRQWNEKMYQMQRKDALADWQMQSAYNSPEQQMLRLKAAGLNPNLVYGNGADAQMSTPPRSSNIPSWNPKAVQLQNLGTGIASYQDAQLKKAQLDNLTAQNSVLVQEAILKGAQVNTEVTRNSKGQFDLSYATEVRDLSKERLLADVMKTQAEGRGATADWQLKEDTMASKIEIAFQQMLGERLKNLKTEAERNEVLERVKLLKQQGILKDWEIRLSKKGMTPRDPGWQRKLAELFDNLF